MRTCRALARAPGHRCAPSGLHLVGDAELGLHVAADIAGDHVGHRKIARGVEAPLHLLEERKVDIHAAIERAVEGP
jgi:hypothetical protein